MQYNHGVLNLLTIACAFSFFITVGAQNSVCPGSRPVPNTLKLKKDLLCEYDPAIRPVTHHSNQTTVYIAFYPLFFVTQEEANIIRISGWLYMQWEDELLKWDPSDYGGLDELITDTSNIWMPDITVINSPYGAVYNSRASDAYISPSGDVYSYTNPVYFAFCTLDLMYWPHDTQTCMLSLRSRSFRGPVLDVRLMAYDTPILKYYQENKDWQLVSINATRNATKLSRDIFKIYIQYQLTIKRHSSFYTASIIVPGIVLSLVALCVFWIDPNSPSRLLLIVFLIFSHGVYARYLDDKLRSNHNKHPYIVVFFRDSLVMAAISLLVTMFSRVLSSLSSGPYWLHSTAAFITRSKYLTAFLITDLQQTGCGGPDVSEDESSLVERTHSTVHFQWIVLTTFIDRICFILFAISYLVFYVTLFP